MQLTQDFVDQCPLENGFRIRGLEMTRIEVLVDAAFGFAITMMVISFEQMPRSFDELMTALKYTPTFIAAVAQLLWIWHAHNTWSRRYGLENAMTVFLSGVLLIVVLVYIYPLRIMAQGMFSWFTAGFFPDGFDLQSVDQLRYMFAILGVGFALLCGTFSLMYRYAGGLRQQLLLSPLEIHNTVSAQWLWGGCGIIGLLSGMVALAVPPDAVPFSGFIYAFLGVYIPGLEQYRRKKRPAN